jgi:hypothetical protein
MTGLILIGYDGSADAQRAVEAAGTLDPDAALVVTVWQPSLAAADTAMPLGGAALPYPEQDEEREAAGPSRDRPGTRVRHPGPRGVGGPLRGVSA